MKYLSKEWAEAVKKKSGEDTEYLKKTKGATFKYQWVVTSCPGGVDKFFDWEVRDGKVISVTLEEKPTPGDFEKRPFDPKQYLTRVTANYETWVRLNKGEMSAFQARRAGVFQIEGKMVKIIPKLGQIQASTDMAGSVPAEY